jgi:RNA polymerase sigma factor (sigma-70 family)
MTSIDSLHLLLDKLTSGDNRAAEEAFRAFEPYLRKVVRRLLPARMRTKFDSIDIVQSVYGDVLTAFRERGMRFGSVAQLRAFLIRATRNRFIDRLRQHQTAARREEPLSLIEDDRGPASSDPRPSESAEAAELWHRLLALCPVEHHELLRLRRVGLPMGEIAARVGMHEGSVRRVLRELSVRLACGAARSAS